VGFLCDKGFLFVLIYARLRLSHARN